MSKADKEQFAALVGKAFRCPDGLIRWITRLSARGYYHVLWLSEQTNVWHSGGIISAREWKATEEAPAPQAGDTYQFCEVTGVVSERTIDP